METILRIATLFVIGAVTISAASFSGEALAASVPHVGPSASSPVVEVAAHCKPGWHYVRGHRLKSGKYLRGHCVRNVQHH